MRAAVFKGSGRPHALEIETLPDPEPGPSDLIVKVRRCGICGTDVHMTSGHGVDFDTGLVIGHEYAGDVVAVGREVERFRVGDRVSGMAARGCGQCEACFHGLQLLCAKSEGGMGGFGELLRLPEKAAAGLTTTLSIADGALVEPLTIGLHGIRMANMPIGSRVLVLGGGSVALAVIFWARRMGAGRVVAASRSVKRAEMALAMGADAFVQTGEDEVARATDALGGPPDFVFECVGVVGMLGAAIAHVKTFGEIVSLGVCHQPDPVVPLAAAFKQVKLSFALAYTAAEFQYAADTMLAGKVDPKLMITSTVGLDALPDTLEMLREPSDQTKVHVLVDR